MSDAICACLGQPLFENRLILGLTWTNSIPIPSPDRLWVTLPTAEKFALEFEIFRLTLVPLGEEALTVTKQPQRLRSRVREMSRFRDSTLITSTALTK